MRNTINENRQRLPEKVNPAVERFSAAIKNANILMESDEGSAAAVVDGLLVGMVEQWYVIQGIEVPSRENLLEDLAEHNQNAAWRLRHALRAPDVEAHVGHCQDMFSMLFGENS